MVLDRLISMDGKHHDEAKYLLGGLERQSCGQVSVRGLSTTFGPL